MHAIIMAAGEGTRMWPLSSLMNKHLLKLGGKPVIRHIWEKLDSEPTRPYMSLVYDITIVCLKKDIKDYQWEFRDTDVNFHVLEENKGTADEFYEVVLKTTKGDDDPFLLHYGDTITDLDYKFMIEVWNKNPKDALIAITKNIKHDYSQVILSPEEYRVTQIIEKPKLTVPAWTGIGIFKTGYFLKVYNELHPKIVEPLDFGYHVLPEMTRDGQLYAYQYDGKWFDVGNLRSYQKLQKEYQNKDLNL